jgi:ferredoxin-thioredoxin reductase catalytic subunit
MRIYNEDTDKKVNKVILYLSPDEAQELKDSLESIINNNEKHQHEHIPDREDAFKREITVCIYRKDNLSSFDERSKKLILNDE